MKMYFKRQGERGHEHEKEPQEQTKDKIHTHLNTPEGEDD